MSGALRLVGGRGALPTSGAVRTAGSGWPYATTPLDCLRRAMPLTVPRSNDIVADGTELDAAGSLKVRMPDRDGFVDVYKPVR